MGASGAVPAAAPRGTTDLAVPLVAAGTPASGPVPPPALAPSASDPLPFPPPGVLTASVNVGNSQSGAVYDSQNHYVYIASSQANQVTVLNGTDIVTIIDVPGSPIGGGFNPANGLVYIASYLSDSVTLINGTTILTTLTVGTDPYGAVYDPSDGMVYVPNYGSNNVTEISDRTVQPTAIAVGTGPIAAAYDPADHDVYVADYGARSVSVINGASVVANVPVGSGPSGVTYDSGANVVYVANSLSHNLTLVQGTKSVSSVALTSYVFGAAYDGANGYVYVADNGSTNVTVVNGTSVVATLAVASGPYSIAVDSWTGCVYVADIDSNEVSVISAGLIEGGVVATPLGTPANSTDLSQSMTLNSTLYANASWVYVATLVSSPSVGLGCSGPPTLHGLGGRGYVTISCTPTEAALYQVSLNVTAAGRISAVATMRFEVFAKPSAPAPVASSGVRTAITSSDITLSVGFNETPVGGSGVFPTYLWTGLPILNCNGLNTSHPTCRFTKTGPYTIQVAFTDSNGLSATSTNLALTIHTLPTAAVPTANRTSVDVGQPVAFTTQATGGSGAYVYHWVGLPVICATSSSPTIDCAPTTPPTISVSVYVTDSDNGNSPTTAPVDVVVFSDPAVSAPVATPQELATGETFSVSVTVSGGPGNETINWSGLPNGCSFSDLTVTCRTTTSGTYEIYATVTDGNGFVVRSKSLQVVVSGSAPNGPNGPGGSGSILGLPADGFYALIGVVILVLLVVAALVAYRIRRGAAGESAPGPPEEAPPEDELPPEGEGSEEPPPEEAPEPESYPEETL